MTLAEFRRWAIEQAVASFGASGCDNAYEFRARVALVLETYDAIGADETQPSNKDAEDE